MKRVIAFVAIGLMAGSATMAESIRDNCGCGLGTMALGDEDPTVISQLAATFMNHALCGNQTFGISSGTLDCAPAVGFAQSKQVKEYVAANLDNLAVDVAQGEGATLEALADLMKVPAAQRSVMYSKLQIRFDDIFVGAKITSDAVVQNMDKVLNG